MPELILNPRARRLFLDRHALSEAPSGPATGQALQDLIERIGFVQVDSINTVARAHDMILWSRRQAFRPPALKRLLERDRSLWEHWTHDASILPVRLHGVWQHRFKRDEDRLHKNWKAWFRDGYEAQFDNILNRITKDGPVGTADVGEGEVRGKGGWWDWHPSKTALEWLWRTGRIAVTRREGFAKIYDLTERVIPEAHRAPVPAEDVADWACRSALRQLGFGTSGEIAAYWKAVGPEVAKLWCREALAQGEIIEAEVEGAQGQRRKVFIFPEILDETPPEPTPRLRILSPFDPALRDRDRAEFLFGFYYRIEVFVPEPKRVWGYYVLPVLEGERLVGRIDVKAFRDAGALRVKAFWPEAGVKLTKGRRGKLEGELDRLARFAGCERVEFLDGWERETLGVSK
ncbi:MAG: crosslink repair DNA glycosylase YcaQ family protein [Tabrizicola sp.]|uniref:winged helix-turn-helix domain-containing protein n=1 Tax=Tabrizicola sp. TaxID=2005166 RepID=UPI001B74A7CE|nr:YcaQ family DNA glycosylase [Tabrizicola sp.]